MNTSRSLVIFFQDYFPLIQRKCARMLGDSDEATDVAQETFVRLWSSPLVSDTPAARLAWINRTSTRLAIDCLRRQQLGVEVRGDADARDRGAMADKVLHSQGETLATRRYDGDFLRSHRVDEFTVTTQGGIPYLIRYWGGPCAPFESDLP